MKSSNTPRDHTGLWLTLILVLSIGVFAPTVINGYTSDDPHYARATTPGGDRNPMVASLQPFSDYWGKPMNWGLPTSCRGFRPITVFSYALINEFVTPLDPKGEDNAWAQHLCNLVLHGLAVLLVFFLVRGLTGRTPALIASLVFGVHAIHSGAVASIVGRAEILTFVFGCTAALLYTTIPRQLWARRAALAGTGISMMFALGAKENGLAWVGIIPLIAWTKGIRWRSQLWPAALSLVVPMGIYLVLRQAMLIEHVHPRGTFWVEYDANPLFYLPFVERLINATCILAFGLGKVLLPYELSSNYGDGPFSLIDHVLHWRFLVASLLFVTLAVAGWRLRTRHQLLSLGIAGFFGFTFVTSNIPLPLETIFADRTFYAAVLALALVAAWLAHSLPRRARKPAIALLVAWSLFNVVTSTGWAVAWHDNGSLTRHSLRNQPDSVGLHIDMGNQRLWEFDAAGGLREFQRALEINPRSARALRFVAEHTESAEQAEALLRRALASPHLVLATEGRRIHWALGNLHKKAGRLAAARISFHTALACNPYVADIRLHLLREAALSGDLSALRRLLDEGQRLLPAHRPFEVFQGVALHLENRHREATELFGKILLAMPTSQYVVEAWLCHADSLAHLGRRIEAHGIATRFARQTARFENIEARCKDLLERTAPASPRR